jgi:Polyprenyl synthetase
MTRKRAKSADQTSFGTPKTTETPGALRSPPVALREPRRLLSSTPFQSSSGKCRIRAVMDAPNDFAQRLATLAADIEALLDRLLGAAPAPGEIARPERLLAAMRHAMLGGGKRLRPFLLVECAALFGAARSGALLAGAALECLHGYSLVHDDLPAMDDDELRRGRPTVHKAFDACRFFWRYSPAWFAGWRRSAQSRRPQLMPGSRARLSTPEFPANREINREFRGIRPSAAISASSRRANLMTCS